MINSDELQSHRYLSYICSDFTLNCLDSLLLLLLNHFHIALIAIFSHFGHLA